MRVGSIKLVKSSGKCGTILSAAGLRRKGRSKTIIRDVIPVVNQSRSPTVGDTCALIADTWGMEVLRVPGPSMLLWMQRTLTGYPTI